MNFKESIVQLCSELLVLIWKLFTVPGPPFDFFRGEVSLHLNRLFNSRFVHRMIEVEGYQSIHMLFTFIFAF